MSSTVIIPTSGQLQVPGSQQSYARVLIQTDSLSFVGQRLTFPGGPIEVLPEAGHIRWLYLHQGVQRYGKALPIEITQQFIPTDIKDLEIVSLLVVLALGVTASVSIRRFAT